MMYKLLRDHVTEERYVAIVRNQILVDIQGNDILYQIFTRPILQRHSGEEGFLILLEFEMERDVEI